VEIDSGKTLLSEVQILSMLEVFESTHFKFVTLVILEHVTEGLNTFHVDVVEFANEGEGCLEIAFELEHFFLRLEANASHFSCESHILDSVGVAQFEIGQACVE